MGPVGTDVLAPDSVKTALENDEAPLEHDPASAISWSWTCQAAPCALSEEAET